MGLHLGMDVDALLGGRAPRPIEEPILTDADTDADLDVDDDDTDSDSEMAVEENS
jgi:hypothetical protein